MGKCKPRNCKVGSYLPHIPKTNWCTTHCRTPLNTLFRFGGKNETRQSWLTCFIFASTSCVFMSTQNRAFCLMVAYTLLLWPYGHCIVAKCWSSFSLSRLSVILVSVKLWSELQQKSSDLMWRTYEAFFSQSLTFIYPTHNLLAYFDNTKWSWYMITNLGYSREFDIIQIPNMGHMKLNTTIITWLAAQVEETVLR